MGADLYYLSERINRRNGALAEGILSKIINIMDDDEPFKEQRISRLVDEYKNKREEV